MSAKDKIKARLLSRRQFIVGGGAALALPPLISLMPSRLAYAAMNDPKKRFVVYINKWGVAPQHLYPEKRPNGLQSLAGALDTLHRPLRDIPGRLSHIIDESFRDLYPYMNVMRGLSMTGGNYQNHNKTILAGTHSEGDQPTFGRTIDVVLEKSNSLYRPGDSMVTRALRITNSKHVTAMSWDATAGGLTTSSAIYGDANLFNRLFGHMPDEIAVSSGPSQNDHNDKLLVDRVLEDLNSLKNNRRLSSEDKILLDRYVSSVHDLQKRVMSNTSNADGRPDQCTMKPPFKLQAQTEGNTEVFPTARWGITHVGSLFENYNDMIKLAFACDLTRVVFIGNFLWQDELRQPNADAHFHHKASEIDSSNRHRWGLKKMASLARKLRDFDDPWGDGNLLDNSVIFFTNELGDQTTGHSVRCMPAVTFGKCGGGISSGHYVDYYQSEKPYQFAFGRPYKQLLQTLMRAMGVSESEYSVFGRDGYGEFKEFIRQNGKNFPNVFTKYKNEHNKVLPLISRAIS